MKHDYCYSNGVPKNECDKEMLKDLGKSKNKTFGEKVLKNVIVKTMKHDYYYSNCVPKMNVIKK